MNYFESNRQILAKLFDESPESLKDLNLNNHDLVYNNDKISLDFFDLNKLMTPENNFKNDLSILTSNDIFNIIKIHTEYFKNNTVNNQEKNEQEKNNQEKDDYKLISASDFYSFLNETISQKNVTEEEVSVYYKFLENTHIYEKYLTPELKMQFRNFENYIAILRDNVEKTNERQKGAINKFDSFSSVEKDKTKEDVNQYVKKLTLDKNVNRGASVIGDLVLAILLGIVVAGVMIAINIP